MPERAGTGDGDGPPANSASDLWTRLIEQAADRLGARAGSATEGELQATLDYLGWLFAAAAPFYRVGGPGDRRIPRED